MENSGKRRERGFTLIELLIVVAIIGLVSAIAIPQYRNVMVRSHVAFVAAESRTIYNAFLEYYRDNSQYPNATSSPTFQLDTFEPLRSDGYYRGSVTHKLVAGRADGYDSPDDKGNNQEFWLEMTLVIDPSIRFVVAESNDAPLSNGVELGGIYMYRNGELEPLTGPLLLSDQ